MPTTTIGGITFEGDGSQDYPLLVSTYEELKTSIEQTSGTDTTYIELTGDIDGEEYELGTTFNIRKNTANHPIDLNLAGYAIQNWYISGNRNLTTVTTNTGPLYCLFYFVGSAYIHDGRILNIFGHYTQDFASACVIYAVAATNVSSLVPRFENISFSMDISKCVCAFATDTTSSSSRPIYTNCSFFIQSSTPLGNKGLLDTAVHSLFLNTMYLFNSCDFKFYNLTVECVNASALAAICPPPSSSTNYGKQFNQCRFQGNITIKDKPDETITINRSLVIFNYTAFDNCVFNLHMINEVTDPEGGQHLSVTTHVNYSANRLTLFNTDYLDRVDFPSGSTLYGIVKATTDQMDMRVNPEADIVLNETLHWDVQKG